MMRYLFDQHELVSDFVAQMIPHARARGFGACRCIGIVDEADNELVAGLVYHMMSPEAGLMEISGAALPGRQWATRTTLKMMFQYPFLQCGCQMVLMKILANDDRLARQLKALNFKFIGVPRLFGRDKDGILCCLTDDDWIAGLLCRRFGHHLVDTPAQHMEAA